MSKNVQSDEIVVSGIAGRFPEADDIEELWSKLMNGIELSSTDDRRWPLGTFLLKALSSEETNESLGYEIKMVEV
ncbi:fatty acid synthase-like protein [Dinothrombium tinctorium]|uniref:Fatty acid synthase-like protein n=1 Tax=Dinothrombium tinctorium TaxID=1965070 RepID=A0A3S3RZ25_9ACAR|nr:fatty acid synthase-like protein [Dinothrombium tinctorium]